MRCLVQLWSGIVYDLFMYVSFFFIHPVDNLMPRSQVQFTIGKIVQNQSLILNSCFSLNIVKWACYSSIQNTLFIIVMSMHYRLVGHIRYCHFYLIDWDRLEVIILI